MAGDPAYAVLEFLARNGSDFLDASSLASRAGVPVEGLRDIVEHLIRQGLPVEEHPSYGLRLPIPFDLIDRELVNTELETRGLGARVEGFVETASTNDLAAKADENGSTFFAEHQSKGRGRLGRAWHSPVGTGLWFSVVSKLRLPIEEGWRITLGAGLAVAEALFEMTELKPQLKWPNDVLLNERKVAGVLTESRAERGILSQTVIGIGINVHLDISDFPEDLRETACSIHASGGRVRRGELLVEILSQLEACLSVSTDELRRRWSALCPHWGQDMRVEVEGTPLIGRAEALGEDGAFIVALEDGSRHAVHAGDVTRVRTTA